MNGIQKRRTKEKNAQGGTGPKSAAGKARSAANSRRHGLAVSVRTDPLRAAQVEALAQSIAGPQSSTDLMTLASKIAEDQIDLVRVRQIRRNLFESYWSQTKERKASQLAQQLEVLDRYERRSMSRRNRAIQTFDTVTVLKSCTTSYECISYNMQPLI
jgi:hypothetical protein